AALDEAFASERAVKADSQLVGDLDHFGAAVRDELRRWSARAGGRRMGGVWRGADEFPASLDERAKRDQRVLDEMKERFGNDDIGPRQRRAYTAAIRSVIT